MGSFFLLLPAYDRRSERPCGLVCLLVAARVRFLFGLVAGVFLRLLVAGAWFLFGLVAVFVPIVTFHSFLNSENLQLYKNNLEGPIPTELGKMSNLNELRLNGNFLSGTIPKQLGNLRYLGTFLSTIGALNCGCGEFAHVCVVCLICCDRRSV